MRETGPKTMSKLPLPLTYVVEKVAPRPSGVVTAHRPEDVNRPCHRIAKKKEGKSTNRHVWCSVELREFIRGESPFVQLQNPVFVQLYKCLLQMNLICTAVHHSGAPAAHISGTVGSNIRKYPTAHPGSCRFSPPAPPTRPPTAPGHTAPGTATPFTVSAKFLHNCKTFGRRLAATRIEPAPTRR